MNIPEVEFLCFSVTLKFKSVKVVIGKKKLKIDIAIV